MKLFGLGLLFFLASFLAGRYFLNQRNPTTLSTHDSNSSNSASVGGARSVRTASVPSIPRLDPSLSASRSKKKDSLKYSACTPDIDKISEKFFALTPLGNRENARAYLAQHAAEVSSTTAALSRVFKPSKDSLIKCVSDLGKDNSHVSEVVWKATFSSERLELTDPHLLPDSAVADDDGWRKCLSSLERRITVDADPSEPFIQYQGLVPFALPSE